MGGFGQKNLGNVGSGITVSADGSPEAKTAGITIAWETVPATTAAFVYPNSDTVEVGEKFLRYGTVLCKVTGGASDGKYAPHGATASGGSLAAAGRGNWVILNRSVHEYDIASDHCEALIGGRVYKKRILAQGLADGVRTLTLNGSAGTFLIVVNGVESDPIPYDAANAAAIQGPLDAANLNEVVVSGSGPYTLTLTGSLAVGTTVTLDTDGITGTIPAVTITNQGPTVADVETSFPTLTYVVEN